MIFGTARRDAPIWKGRREHLRLLFSIPTADRLICIAAKYAHLSLAFEFDVLAKDLDYRGIGFRFIFIKVAV